MSQRKLDIIITVSGSALQAITGLRQQVQSFNQTVQQTAQNTQAAGNAISATGQKAKTSTRDFQSYQQSIDEARRSAYAMTIAGFQLVMAGRAITGMLKESVSQFEDYDFSLRRAAGALNVFGDQTPMFAALSDGIQQVAIQTKLFSPEQIAKGMYFWASATGEVASSTADLKRITAEVLPVMKAAAMTETDLEASLKGVVGIIRQYHMSLTSAGDITEKLFLITQKTAVELPDLINSFKMVGPVAAAHNVTLGEMVRLFGAIGDAGIRGTMAGRAFRQMFIQLDKTSKVATATLDGLVVSQLGLNKSFREMVYPEGEFIGMAKYLNLLSELTRGLTEAERNRALAQITTANELGVMTELVRANTQALDENKQGIFDATQSLEGSSSIFARSWDQMTNSAKAMFGELRNRVAPAIFDVAKVLVESFRPIAKIIGDVADAIHKFAQTNPELFKMAVQAVAAAGALLALAGSVLLLVGGLKLVVSAAIPSLLAGLAGVSTKSIAATSNVGLLSTAFGKLTTIMGAGVARGGIAGGLGATKGLFGGLFGGIASSIGGVISAILRIAMLIRTAFIPAMIVASAVTVAIGIAFGIASKIGRSAGEMFKAFGRLAGNLGSIIGTLANIIGGFFVALFNVGKFIGEQLSGWVGGLLDVITNVVNTVSDFLTWIGDRIGELTGDAQKAGQIADAVTGATPDSIAYRLVAPSTQPSYEAGTAAGSAYGEGFADSLTEGPVLDTVAQASGSMMRGVVSKMVAGLQSGKAELRRAALDGVNMVVEEWAKGFDEKNPMPASMKKMIESAKAMLESSNGTVNRMGQLFQVELARGIQTGNLDSVLPAMRFGLDMAQRLIADKRPAVQREGYLMLAAMARGMLANTKPGSAAAVQLAGLIGALESGVPAFAAQGAKGAMAYLSGFAAPFEKTRTYTGGPGGFTILPDAVNPLEQVYKNLISSIEKDTPKSGGGSKQQSPLEKALEVAKQGAELADALSKIEGVNVKALVKQSMGGLAEAMLLADKITAGYAKGISKKTLQQVAEFSDATGKVASLIGSAVESFGKLKDYKRIGAGPMKVIAADLNDAISAIESVSKHFKAKGLVAASLFADSAGSVAKAISGAVGGFVNLSEKGYKRLDPQVLQGLVDDLFATVVAMSEKAQKFKQNSAQVKVLQEFSDTVGSVAKAIGDVFDAFQPKTQKTPGEGETLISPNLVTIFAQMDESLTGIIGIAAKYDEKTLKQIDAMAEAAGKVGDAIKTFFSIGTEAGKTDEGGQTMAGMVQTQLDLIMASVASFVASFKGTGASLVEQLALGMKSQESALAAEVAQINAILGGTGGTAGSIISTQSNEMTIRHVVTSPDGSVGGMSASEIAALLNSGNTFISNLKQSAGTR